ncbi:MAG: hypothetical protein HY863_18450 [Chloroflexi bacterium]|nr:hypothetical protein [Chloroflexota bacterium]
MKSLLKMILDGLTYKDLAGHRQPRAYTVVTGLLLLLLLVTGGMTMFNRHLMMSMVRATPEAIVLSTQAPTDRVPEATQTSQPFIQQTGEISIHCPTDSADWSLTPTFVSENYQVIQPACVYQGLEKTIAWALAIREGYSRTEATEQLGFTEMPMRQKDRVTIPTDQGLDSVPVSFIPPDPDFTEWRLNSQGKAAVTYALRGCFRTTTVVGNRIEVWDGDYSVICLVVEDAENTHIVYALNDHIYTSTATPTRSFLLFGYGSDKTWVWLGTQESPKREIKNPRADANEREVVAFLYDSSPWDAKWLASYQHLMMRTLPENWQNMTDESEKQAILNGLVNGENP